MGWLYLLTFPNDKLYVGQTRQTVPQRFRKHQQRAARGIRGELLYAAWRKHGAPTCTPLFEVPDAELNATEAQLIVTLNTRAPNGYNSTAGGECDLANARESLRKPEVRSKIGDAVRALWADPAYRLRLETAHRGAIPANRGVRYAAKQAGRITYRTGKPCKRGHDSDRYTSTGICIACLRGA
jgi:hypothetical protein